MMHRNTLTPTQEQAFYVAAEALHAGTFGQLLSLQDELSPDTSLPPFTHPTYEPPEGGLTELQHRHLVFLATKGADERVRDSGRQLTRWLSGRYRASSTEQLLRLAVECSDLPLKSQTRVRPSALGDRWERQVTIMGLLSHGLAVEEVVSAVGMSVTGVSNYLRATRKQLGATSPGAVTAALGTGILGREDVQKMYAAAPVIHPTRPQPLCKDGIVPRVQRLFGTTSNEYALPVS